MKLATRLGGFALTLAMAGQVFAQAAAATPTDFATVDKNKDGRVSSVEAEGRTELISSFESLDKNRDGFVSATEFAQWSGAGKALTPDPVTGPSGSGGAQHMPKP